MSPSTANGKIHMLVGLSLNEKAPEIALPEEYEAVETVIKGDVKLYVHYHHSHLLTLARFAMPS